MELEEVFINEEKLYLIEGGLLVGVIAFYLWAYFIDSIWKIRLQGVKTPYYNVNLTYLVKFSIVLSAAREIHCYSRSSTPFYYKTRKHKNALRILSRRFSAIKSNGR